MAHQKDGRKKPNFSSYKKPPKKPSDAQRKARERKGIEWGKRQRALENRAK